MDNKIKITLVGAGNVGFQLGKVLFEKGFHIVQVFSRKAAKAKELADLVNAEAHTGLHSLSPQTNLIILAVSDDAILPVSKAIQSVFSKVNPLVVHTSGATPGEIFSPFFNRYGVFYPLQSFSRDKKVDFSSIPVCIHANNSEDKNLLEAIAKILSPQVYAINDRQRKVLHIAAVIVNNFTNHLYHQAHHLTQDHQIPFELLLPLIKETTQKLEVMSPQDAQTGPAIRKDQQTITQHLEFLKKNDPELAKIYRMLTQSIQQSK